LPASDAADALAAAICHAHASTGIGALARRGYRVRAGRLLSI
ncbi:MAG: crossover junction endodeoxyribonuclease RuvC, partial [Pseudomonadota bacterium]|nr:crossover junction endodeoxyribonuclease RuvC [Pseudomonadota bacterium]